MGHKRVEQDRARHNPVAKYARKFNMAHTFTDRKQKARKGYTKHKGVQYETE